MIILVSHLTTFILSQNFLGRSLITWNQLDTQSHFWQQQAVLVEAFNSLPPHICIFLHTFFYTLVYISVGETLSRFELISQWNLKQFWDICCCHETGPIPVLLYLNLGIGHHRNGHWQRMSDGCPHPDSGNPLALGRTTGRNDGQRHEGEHLDAVRHYVIKPFCCLKEFCQNCRLSKQRPIL